MGKPKPVSDDIISPRSKNYISLASSIICLALTCDGFSKIMVVELPEKLAKAGHLQFLTNISLFFTMIYYVLNILSELIITSKKFYTFKNNYHAIVTTLEIIVTIVYWPLRIFFINMIIKDGRTRIPVELDLTIHLLPLVSLLFDYFLFMDLPTLTNLQAFTICVILAVAYWIHLDILLDENSDFPYPFLNVPVKERIVIFFIISLVAFGSFTFNKTIHRYVTKTFRKGEKALHLD